MNVFAYAIIAQIVLILMKLTAVLSWPWAAVFIPSFTITIATVLDLIVIAGSNFYYNWKVFRK